LRSNLLENGNDTEDVTPDVADTWISTLHLDGTGLVIDGRTIRGYIHPGGMAIEDDILFVAMDTRVAGSGFGDTGMILLFDLREGGGSPEAPVPIQALPIPYSIDNLAVAKLADHYVLWTNGDGGEQVHIYRTPANVGLRENALSL